MGHPKHFASVRAGSSRRGFLKGSGSAAAALASAVTLPLIPSTAPAAGPLFQHGVASGDPLADRVILWTRVTSQSSRRTVGVRWLVARDAQLRDVVLRGDTETSAARDFTVKVDAVGLSPGSTYYYRFFAENEASPIGRTRTLPVGTTPHLRIAVASCSNHSAGLFNAYRRIAERADLDFVLHLGDYTYEVGPGVFADVRVPEPPVETVTLSEYRTRHAQYKRDADLQEVHRQHPMICIWDDGEITNDAWRDGAANHTEGAEGTWPERVAMCLKAYYEWMPVRQVDPAQPRRNERAFRIGDLVDLVMLEERLSARSQQLPATIPTGLPVAGFVQLGPFADPSRTLLGAEQEAWLAARLRDSAARWKVIGQQVMFAQVKVLGLPLAAPPPAPPGGVFLNPDQWDGYQPARDRVYAVLKGDTTHAPVSDVVILTGDLHSSWAADLTQDPNNPFVQAGGYDPVSGSGSRAVEFVGTSISSPSLAPELAGPLTALFRGQNPHLKYIELSQRGYMLLDVTRERAVCEWWFVDTVVAPSNVQTLGAAFEVQHGSNRLAPSAMTAARTNPPPAAP
jgi:alkaline phosphatase D